jgi:hypothetical protein
MIARTEGCGANFRHLHGARRKEVHLHRRKSTLSSAGDGTVSTMRSILGWVICDVRDVSVRLSSMASPVSSPANRIPLEIASHRLRSPMFDSTLLLLL